MAALVTRVGSSPPLDVLVPTFVATRPEIFQAVPLEVVFVLPLGALQPTKLLVAVQLFVATNLELMPLELLRLLLDALVRHGCLLSAG